MPPNKLNADGSARTDSLKYVAGKNILRAVLIYIKYPYKNHKNRSFRMSTNTNTVTRDFYATCRSGENNLALCFAGSGVTYIR